jgi:hypothetical protein
MRAMNQKDNKFSQSSRTVPPLMPEFAIGMTVLLIAAPVVLVGGTMWMAMKKRLSARGQVPVVPPSDPASNA